MTNTDGEADSRPNHGPQPQALLSQENWLRATAEITGVPVYEYPLFSDAHLTGQARDGIGPYSFINAVPATSGPGIVNTAIVLRVAFFLSKYRPNFSKTDESLYHGGNLIDELAALTSLAVGVRIRAGGETRRFEPDGDRFGRPCGWNDRQRPVISLHGSNLVLPAVVGTHSLDSVSMLCTVPQIAPARYVYLIRASRLYQDALWACESDQNLAWLLLVSALETAANEVNANEGTPSDRLRTAKPALASLLEQHGGDGLVEEVATMIVHTLGATKKFLDFTLRFLPDPPALRPAESWFCLDWSRKSMKECLNTVYAYRSRSLHDGIPFPAPMFEAAVPYGATPIPAEVPLVGLASHSHGGTWLPKDTPINLHSFHYIVRGCLLNWWKTLTT